MSSIVRTPDECIEVPETPAIDGIRFRRWRGLEDIPGMAAVAGAVSRAAGSSETAQVEDMLAAYRNLQRCDPGRDIWIVEVDGTIVAYARAWWDDLTSGERSLPAISFVDPEFAERGIEAALLALAERRQADLASTMAAELAGRETHLARYARASQTGEIARLEGAGYRLIRRWAEMRRADLEAIPHVATPEGIRLTRLDAAQASDDEVTRRVFDVGTEVFADHFGEAMPTEADWHRFRESPSFQPRLWCVAIDAASGGIAGHILNYLGEPEPDGSVVGWTESIAVRAPYRRRGIASAMLAESLRIVRDAGATRAALGVDQQNPNHAMALYERLGFRVVVDDLEYHRPIVPGEAAR